MEKIPVYLSKKQAISAAKTDYANLLGVSRKSVIIEDYNGYGSPNSCQCRCGQTTCYEFHPKGISYEKLQKLTGSYRGFWYGVCESCGKKY